MACATTVFLAAVLCLCTAQRRQFWDAVGVEELEAALHRPVIEGRAKNVLLFIGDGMDIVSTTVAGHVKTQGRRKPLASQEKLAFESFPNVALSRTYSVDRLIPDSASTGTALLTGVKANFHVLGFDSQVRDKDCASVKNSSRLESLLLEARKKGRSVGIVTTARLTHATPAACYAQSASRHWENDRTRNRDVPPNLRHQCPDIATQLVTRGVDINVLLGGGRREFLSGHGGRGYRLHGNLITHWKRAQAHRGRRFRYIDSGADLRALNTSAVDYLLGIFTWSHMSYELDREAEGGKEPSLSEMTETAIRILSHNPRGFVLMVEGARIDHGHHGNHARLAITDLLAFDRAVAAAVKMTKDNETLAVVTADHGHSVTFGGYIARGSDVFGPVHTSLSAEPNLAADDMPYTSILYGNGPSGPVDDVRDTVSKSDTSHDGYRYQSIVPLKSETHGGQHVGVYARGPHAHLLHSVHEQNYIAHLIMYSACLGRYAGRRGC